MKRGQRSYSPDRRLTKLIESAEQLRERRQVFGQPLLQNAENGGNNRGGGGLFGKSMDASAIISTVRRSSPGQSRAAVKTQSSATTAPIVDANMNINKTQAAGEVKHVSVPVWGSHPVDHSRSVAKSYSAEQIEELAETRRRAVLRLIDKRRHDQREKTQRTISEKQKENAFRLNWRQGYKEKREEQLQAFADKAVIKEMATNPDSLRKFLGVAGEDEWNTLMADLPTKSSSHENDVYAEIAGRGASAAATASAASASTAAAAATVIAGSSLPKPSVAQEFLRKTCPLHTDEPTSGSSSSSNISNLKRSPGTDAGADDLPMEEEGTERIEKEDGHDAKYEVDLMNYRAGLCETLYFVGPSPAEVEGLIEAASKKTGPNSKSAIFRLDPQLLFVTTKDPTMDWDTLKNFCFPDGIGATTGPHSRQSPMKSFRLMNSTSRFGKRKFVFTLTNHVGKEAQGSRYGICLVLPRVITNLEKGVTVNCEYCLCVITSFPFFHFIFHVLMQFEAMGGLDFGDSLPLPANEEDPIQGKIAYRLLNDLASRLTRLEIPFYPSIVNHSPESQRFITPGLRLRPISLNIAVKNRRKVGMKFQRDQMQHYFCEHKIGSVTDLPSSKEEKEQKALQDLESINVPEDYDEASLEKERDNEVCFQTLLWALPILLRHLPLDQIVVAIGCALTEMKVIVSSSDPTIVSGCVLALVNLLRPMKWATEIAINVSGELLLNLLDTPTFIFLGVPALPEGFGPPQGFAVVDPEERVVHLHPTDTVLSHTITLPQSSKLVASLKGYAETILSVSRQLKRRSSTYVSNMNSTSNYNFLKSSSFRSQDGAAGAPPKTPPLNPETARAVPPVVPRSPAPLSYSPSQSESHLLPEYEPLALPIELDPLSELGKQLFSAVAGFRATMMRHLQALVNTAVQSAWEEKRVERDKRHAEAAASAMAMEAGNNKKVPKVQSMYISKASRRATSFHSSTTRSHSLGGGSGGKPGSFDPTINEIQQLADHYADSPVAANAPVRNWESAKIEVTRADLERLKEDEEAEVDENSVSTSNSLPKVVSGSTSFAMKDIGASGIKFVKRLRDTQAFANYCHVKSKEGRRGRARAMEDLRESLPMDSPLIVKDRQGLVERHHDGPEQVKDLKIKARSPPEDVSTLGFAAEDHKSLVTLFAIILTGTLPMSKERVETLRLAYELNEYQNKMGMSEAAAIDVGVVLSVGSNSASAGSGPEGSRGPIASLLPDKGGLESNIVWCNGRCGGLANTSNCTNICLLLWEQRVHIARHQRAVKQIIHKHQHNDKQLRLYKNGARQQPSRQHRETDSQYQLRAKILSGQTDATEAPVNLSRDYKNPRKPIGGKGAARSPHRTASQRMAQYFSVKKTWTLMERQDHALDVLCIFLLSCRDKLRARRLALHARTLQRIARGYIVRSKKSALFAALEKRKFTRLMARIRIWRWIRQIPDAIHDARQNKMLLRKKKKLKQAQKIVLPSATAASRQTASAGKSPATASSAKDAPSAHAAKTVPVIARSASSPSEAKHPAVAPVKKTNSPAANKTTTTSSSPPAPSTSTAASSASKSVGEPAPASKHGTHESPPATVTSRDKEVRKPRSDTLSTVPPTTNLTVAARSKSDTKIAVPKLPVLLIAELKSMQASPVIVPSQSGSKNDAQASNVGLTVPVENGNTSGKKLIGTPDFSDQDTPRTHARFHQQPDDRVDSTDSAAFSPSADSMNDRTLDSDVLEPFRDRAMSAESSFGYSEKASKTDALFLSGSLSGLGFESRDSFTPQQREILLGMWSVLREGVEVVKHGRTGRPKQRFLYCDAHMKALFWRATGGKVNAEQDAEFTRSSNGPSMHHWGITKLIRPDDSDRFISFKDIVEVRDDYRTDVMRRSEAKRFISSSHKIKTISIVAHDRTLDFELEESQWNKLFHALQIITNHFDPSWSTHAVHGDFTNSGAGMSTRLGAI